MIILVFFLQVRWFHVLKWTGFLAERHLFSFNTLRIVHLMEEPSIIYYITRLLLMTLHWELLPHGMLSYSIYWCADIFSKSLLILINHLWTQFHAFKKVRNISRFDRGRQSQMRDFHLCIHALNRQCGSQICIRRIYCPVLSLKK